MKEYPPALDTLRLQMAAQFHAAKIAFGGTPPPKWSLAEADALLEEARK